MKYLLLHYYVQQVQNPTFLQNCFKQSSILTLDQNQNQFYLHLSPTNASFCSNLNGDVQFTLTFGSKNEFKQNEMDYKYNKQNKIVFNIQNTFTTEENFAVIHISNYQFQTEFNVIFEELKLDLRVCFNLLEVKFTGFSASFTMCPLTNCLNAIVMEQHNNVQHITQIQLSIFQYQYNISTEQLVNAYQTYKCHTENISINSNQMQSILKQSFIVANFILTVVQGVRSSQVSFPTIVNIDDVSNVFSKQEAYLYTTDNDTGYNVLVQYDLKKLNKASQVIDNLKYDRVEIKLSVAQFSLYSMVRSSQLHMNFTLDRFNSSQTSYLFSCNGNMKGEQQKTCYQMLYNDYNTQNTLPSYNLDIIFYQNGQLVYLLKAPACMPIYSCWTHGVAIISNSGIELQLTRNYYCDFYQDYYSLYNVTATLLVNDNQFVKSVDLIVGSNVNKFKFTCTEINCQALNSSSRIQLDLFIVYFVERIVIQRVFDSRRQNQLFLLANISIVLIFFTVFGFKMKRSFQLIEEYRGEKRKTKLSNEQIALKELVKMVQK
ncbi:Conserved_hypothetical protein [Hexamita inflata]|uniref:Transmembrane protein n=1 Tax=Hexamita inflata TaxID=28002 RepID=A0AA86PNV3_9EUKA|nr:Conserved hypothetical protein [Hexamita inflata]